MIRSVALSLALAVTTVSALPLYAQEHQADELFDLLRLPDIISIMREEGMASGETIGEDLFSGGSGAEWSATVEHIYDYEVMTTMVRADFEAALDGAPLGPMIAFFGSDQGQRIVMMELDARRAMMDTDIEEAAKEAAAIAAADEDARFQQVAEFIEVNALVDANVAAALNSNFAFFSALADGGAFGGSFTEDQILSDVWAQEGEIRMNSSEWMHAFLFMAYAPLEDADLEAYIAFSHSEAGEQFNQAIFQSFDRVFNGISRSLGLAAAKEMNVQDL